MKKFKIIGFLVMVLFFGFFWKEQVRAEYCAIVQNCYTFCDKTEQESLCVKSSCTCVDCVASKGFMFDSSTHSCVSQCKSQPGTVWNGSKCIFSSSTPSGGSIISDSATSSSISKVNGDPRCWTKEQCITYREKTYEFTNEEAARGFYSAIKNPDARDACGTLRGDKEMGFCSPNVVAKTEIGFGSVQTFANFGAFLQFIYKYSFVAATILGVLMIIFAGVEWLTSAGSQERIGSAKKRIIGSIIGLLILAFSFTILNTINPYLVNFRLPQVWLINSSLSGIEFCRQIPDFDTKERYNLAGSSGKVFSAEELKSAYQAGFNLSYNQADFKCGNQYTYSSAPNTSLLCQGSTCPDKQICMAIPDQGYKCVNGVLSGNIDVGDFVGQLSSGWDDNAVNDIDFYMVCENGEKQFLNNSYTIYECPKTEKQCAYLVSADDFYISEARKKCDNKVAGFLLYPDFDEQGFWISFASDWDWIDEPHWLGQNPNTKDGRSTAVDLGDRWTTFFEKLKNNQQIRFQNSLFEPKKFLIPDTYIEGNTGDQFQLNIVVKEVTDID